jgi:hypothetical protein
VTREQRDTTARRHPIQRVLLHMFLSSLEFRTDHTQGGTIWCSSVVRLVIFLRRRRTLEEGTHFVECKRV